MFGVREKLEIFNVHNTKMHLLIQTYTFIPIFIDTKCIIHFIYTFWPVLFSREDILA